MVIRSSVFSAPTNVMALGHPFASPAYNTVPGIPLGIDMRSRQLVYFDPWLLKNAGVINSAFGLVLGPKGHGKSALLKILTIRLMLLAAGYGMMRTAINDYKPEGKESEYAEFSRVCQSEVFRIADMSVNPFEPRLFLNPEDEAYELGILGTAEVLCEFAKKSDLVGHETTALRIGLHAMLKFDRSLWSPAALFKVLRSISNEQIDAYFKDLDNKLVQQLQATVLLVKDANEQRKIADQLKEMALARDNYNPVHIQFAADKVSAYLGDILTGSYAKMFGSTHSLYDMLTQRAVTKDWRGVEPEAETLMRTLDTRIKSAAIENNRIDLLPHVEDDDEKHKSMDNEGYASSHSYFSEIARGTHTCNLSATHRLDSIRKGDVGSKLYNLGNTIINNLGFVFIGQQPDDPKILDELKARYDLSSADRDVLTSLPPHTFGMKLGETEPIRFIQIFATPKEMTMLETNSATNRMIDRPDVFAPEQIERFAEENGIALAGEAAIG